MIISVTGNKLWKSSSNDIMMNISTDKQQKWEVNLNWPQDTLEAAFINKLLEWAL